jgi:hypothetical protein
MGIRYRFNLVRPPDGHGCGREERSYLIDWITLMPSPLNRPVPRFAPEGSITLISALDIFGRAVDAAWTGEEIKADTAPEPSDEHLANLAFARVTREAADNPRGEDGDENPSERQILDSLHADRDEKFAARRRWKAAAIRFMRYCHQGRITPSAIGNDGMVHEVPAHLWASEHAEDLFDNGGRVELRVGQLAVPRGLTQTDAATVLVDRDDLRRLITAITEGDIPAAAPEVTTEHPDRYRTGLPGRPTIGHLIEDELRRRIAAGECKATISAEARALREWAIGTHPDAARATVRTIENQIRSLYNALVPRTK